MMPLIHEKSPYAFITPELDLDVIRKSFDEIPLDPYFEYGYRYRTQSRYSFDGNLLKRLPVKPLFQPSYINSFDNYGGITREYQDLPAWIETDPAFIALVKTWLATFPYAGEDISLHQIRTTTNQGLTVPEGRHRDGYHYIGVFVVDRRNITPSCAKTTVWKGTSEDVLYEGVMPPGTLLSFDDRQVTHFVEPIEAEDVTTPCSRDVIILTSPDLCIG